jgi:GNAT superfamily N-acetyltransferase
MRRRLHAHGAAFTAVIADREIGYVEVDDDFTRNGTMLRCDGWADVSNFSMEPDYRRQGIATWLLQHAAEWLRLGGTRNLIAYLDSDELETEQAHWYRAAGFTELNRTRRGWRRAI